MQVIPESILVTTTPTIEGYKIVAYLGVVSLTVDPPAKFIEDSILDEMNAAILQKAIKKGGNAVVGVFSTVTFNDMGFPRRFFMSGTCVLVQRIS